MIEDYVADLRRALRRLPEAEREAVLDEVQAHLADEAKELEASGMDPVEALAEAIRRFGEPHDIAAGYEAGSGEVRRDGEVMLKVARVAGQGAKVAAVGVGKGLMGLGRLLGVVAITAMIVAGVIAVAALAFAEDWAPLVAEQVDENVGRELFQIQLEDAADESFFVPEGAATVVLEWQAGAGSGCSTLRLVQPNGTLHYERMFCPGDAARTTIEPISGTWRLHTEGDFSGPGYVYVGYRKA